MNKYTFIFIMKIKSLLRYRSNFVLTFISSCMPLLVLFYLWTDVYRGKTLVNGMTYKEMFTYYLLALLLTTLFQVSTAWEVAEDIRTGKLNNDFLKPINYTGVKFVSYLSEQMTTILVLIIIFTLANLVFSKYVIGISSIIRLASFVLAVILGTSITFYFSYIIGIVTFWWKDIEGLFYFQAIVFQFLSGSIIPIDWYPTIFRNIVMYLPFSYTIYFPIKLYLGKLSSNEIIVSYTILIFWNIILYLIYRAVWDKGRKLYDGYGG